MEPRTFCRTVRRVAGTGKVKHSRCGAEGTLGIITEVTVRLVPLPPVSVHILSVFSSAQEALSLITVLPKNRIETTCLEFMDNESIRAVERFTGERQVASEKGKIGRASCRERVCQYV